MTDQTLAGEPNVPPSNASASNEWFYVYRGDRKGPVSAQAIQSLVDERELGPEDQIWRKGLGEWVSIRNSELGETFGSEPPPLSAEHINNSLVWILALLPLVYALINAYLATLPISLFGRDFAVFALQLFPQRAVPWWIGLVANGVLCVWDEVRLSKAGHGMGWMTIFALLFLPVYLFVRAKKLKQWPTYAIAWIITFLGSLFVTASYAP